MLRVIFPRPPSRDNGATRAVLTREVIVIPDITEDAEYGTTDDGAAAGFRSVLAVPLMRDGEPIGAISLGRDVPGPFPPSHIELLQTFAAQAVIAIENVRLFTELGKRNAASPNRSSSRPPRARSCASSAGRRRTCSRCSTPSPSNALRLCDGMFSAVFRFDGELIHFGALRNLDAGGRRRVPRRVSLHARAAAAPTQRAILTGAIVHMPDIRRIPTTATTTSPRRPASAA